MPAASSASPLRVLHVVESWRPRGSGYTTRSWEIAQAQARHEAMNPHVLVTSRQHAYGFDNVDAPPALQGRVTLAPSSQRERWLRRVRSAYVDAPALEAQVRHVALACRADVIHGHWSSGIGRAAARAAEALGVPFVAEVRFDLAGAVMTETVKHPVPLLEHLLRRWFEHHLAHANAVVAASYSLADLLRREVPAARGRLTVVPNGVDRAGFAPGPRDEALRHQLSLDGQVVVGSTTNMLRYEGLDLLLRALPAAQVRSANLRVLLVGSGTQHEALRRQAARAGLPVTFAGHVPKEEVPRYLRLMDLFAVPRRSASITQYASPIKVVEAMACGVPVIGSRVGDLPTLLGEGRGRLVAPGSVPDLAEALCALATDAPERAAMSRAARAWAEAYLSWSDTPALYRDVYRTALSQI